jgi:hypothetical protein
MAPGFEVAAWSGFYVAVFTLIQILVHGSGDLVNDTLEAFAWGQQLQLGYFKHPPFWAWVAYGWFSIFPTEDWAAYLLASVNAAIGLACTWCIGRRFLSAERATGAMLCLMLTATYVCLAQRFNANTILISLWPATALAVLRGIERNRLVDGALAGLLATFSLLSKYTSALFLLELFAFVYFMKGSARVSVSRGALVCYAVALLALMPHLVWLERNDYLPFHYMQITTARPWSVALQESVVFIFSSAGFVGIAVLAYFWASGAPIRRLPAVLASGFRGRRGTVAILVFGVELLTIASCLVRSSTLKPIYAIPMYFMVPIWVAMASELPFDAVALRRLRRLVGAIFLLYLAASPIAGFVMAKLDTRLATRPKDEVTAAVTQEWHRRYHRPLRIVGGDKDYAIAVPFYSADHPSYLIGFDVRELEEGGMPMSHGPADFSPRLSPWIDMAAMRQDGLAIICADEWATTTQCKNEATQWLGAKGVEFELPATETDFVIGEPTYKFHIFFLPPG